MRIASRLATVLAFASLAACGGHRGRARSAASAWLLARPIDTNDTEAGRARNRRVELRIVEQR
jgi:flagellar motor protein MotB